MDIKAFKMDGLGNDFIIIDQRNNNLNLSKDQIIKICDRNYIGCDQLIFIEKNEKKDAGLEFYNSDGSISGACGNGTRCVADLLSKENNDKEIILWTSNGPLKSKILGNNLVETEIGIPKTNWNEIPLSKDINTKNLNIKIIGKNNIEHFGGTSVNVGNPHIVFFVDNIDDFDLKKTEQYYMLIDPNIKVLAISEFDRESYQKPGKPENKVTGSTMPVVWKKNYGKGRIFFSSIGHKLGDFEVPEVMSIQMRGFRWAAEGKYMEEESTITPVYKK